MKVAGIILGIAIMCLPPVFMLTGSGCDKNEAARREAYREPHDVTLWSGGKAIGQWRSGMRPDRYQQSSIIGFVDQETGEYVMVRGTVSIVRAE